VLFANGRAGERFAVRNSGGVAVVEGIGDHGCEYMTGGTVVVLGSTGKNFGAGMTGGSGYVLDLEEQFEELYNPGLVVPERLTEEDTVVLQQLIYRHLEATDSARAREVLGNWPKYGGLFWKVTPRPPVAKPAESHPPAKTEAVITEAVVATQPLGSLKSNSRKAARAIERLCCFRRTDGLRAAIAPAPAVSAA
jgi:glutamate synthase (NADPH/NADH) large chain/glutamate synthase (ferredoxin)